MLLFRNQLHPITIFSCFILTLSIFSLGIAGQLFADRAMSYDYSLAEAIFSLQHWSWEDFLGFCIFLGIGAFLLTGALGLIFHKNWARHLLQLGFIITAGGWLFFLSSNTYQIKNAPIIFSGITATILGFVIGSLLFLNNTQWVLPYFRDYAQEEAGQTILDQEFTHPNDQHNA